MAEELYLIKTNPTVAKINLYNKLCREEENIRKFLQYDNKTDLEKIKEKVKDSIEELTKQELLHIFSWFSTLYSSDHEEAKTQLFINGIDLFYEITSVNNVNSFLQILSDYEKNVQQHLDYIVSAQRFNHFLIYGIFFTEITNKDQGGEHILSDYLKSDYPSLYALAENQSGSINLPAKNNPDLQHYFTDLYDLTKFYKGSIIQLEYQ